MSRSTEAAKKRSERSVRIVAAQQTEPDKPGPKKIPIFDFHRQKHTGMHFLISQPSISLTIPFL
jgi:hypothetical protein